MESLADLSGTVGKGNFLNSYPGMASLISYDLKYLAVNQQLADFFNKPIDYFVGKPINCKNDNLRENIEQFINQDYEVKTWEVRFDYPKFVFAISAKKLPEGIVLSSVDITNVKISEERNLALIKSIPQVLRQSDPRRSNNNLEDLIEKLTEDPLFSNSGIQELSQSQIEKLIKLEVEIREAGIRLKNVEKLLYMSDNSIIARLRELEFRQKQDEDSRENIDSDLFSLRVIGRVISQTPGGIKTWLFLMTTAIVVAIFSIDLSIRFSGIDKLKNLQQMHQTIEDVNK
ncbi:hypothetical protein [Lyngbya sp. PCC 8106]|uniref:hypothetical protein n=1 Tax=Lyngbya sp. (strain PCC 8106) TaxID=313612 RepID=UPI0000EA991B|nr:hypothetical protein [Lyngbya sp. PCC 8106]EAW35157.1 hypothetical protein L8106_13620 [Lyngbya sp. PCC 8106]